MQIGELAAAVGVTVDAVRLYEARGLIRSIRRPNGYRHFSDSALTVLRLVKQAQALGFSLAEIADVLKGLSGDLPPEAVRALLEDRLARVETQIQGLSDLKGLLQARLTEVCALGLQASSSGKGRS